MKIFWIFAMAWHKSSLVQIEISWLCSSWHLIAFQACAVKENCAWAIFIVFSTRLHLINSKPPISFSSPYFVSIVHERTFVRRKHKLLNQISTYSTISHKPMTYTKFYQTFFFLCPTWLTCSEKRNLLFYLNHVSVLFLNIFVVVVIAAGVWNDRITR